MSQIKKVRNWSEYNKSLEKRGEIIIYMTEKFYNEMYYTGKRKVGGVQQYTDKMFEFTVAIKSIMKLPLRATVGFIKTILNKIYSKEHKVPNFGHISRMVQKLNLEVNRYDNQNYGDGIVLAFDSTGVSIHSTSGWHQRKHGGKTLDPNERWKKIHVAMDLQTGMVLDVEMTDSNTNDCTVVKDMVNNIKEDNKIDTIIGDGAYDTFEVYQIAHELGANVIIPPDTTSKAQDELKNPPKKKKEYLKDRDEAIKFIRQFDNFKEGRKEWKKMSGYYKRSNIEALMNRFKSTFGFSLKFKKEKSRVNEVKIKMTVLNTMLTYGRAEYV